VTSLGGLHYRLARSAILGTVPAAWPGWTFVQMKGCKQPLLVHCHGSRLRAAHRAPHRKTQSNDHDA
jgi:hypothetical protein